MTAPLLAVTDLVKTFDVSPPFLERMISRLPQAHVKAVDGVSFDIGRGETFALVGESGSGKSTIARLVVGLLDRTGGAAVFEGVDITALDGHPQGRELRRKMQMIFQDPLASLNPRWRVKDIIAEPIRTFGLLNRDDKAITTRVGDLLERVGLSRTDAEKFPHQFSGGQRQRIAIARALSAEPDFIVCDEPTSALDVSVQAQILNLMADLQDQLGLTFLFISHNLAVVRHMADRIGVLYLGRLVETGPADAVFANPRHPYTQMLIGAVPDLDGTSKDFEAVKGEIPNPINPPSGCHFHPRCPKAEARCKSEAPVLTDGVACHFA